MYIFEIDLITSVVIIYLVLYALLGDTLHFLPKLLFRHNILQTYIEHKNYTGYKNLNSYDNMEYMYV